MTNNEIDRHSLSMYLNEFLNVAKFKDYAPNGLQVQGKDTIRTIVTGVTACQPLIEQAIALNADAILVHHGFFWKNEPEVLTGMKYKRIKALMDHDISLFGYHLPLDAHHGVGNASAGHKLDDSAARALFLTVESDDETSHHPQPVGGDFVDRIH